jgi:hypothetical protein
VAQPTRTANGTVKCADLLGLARFRWPVFAFGGGPGVTEFATGSTITDLLGRGGAQAATPGFGAFGPRKYEATNVVL